MELYKIIIHIPASIGNKTPVCFQSISNVLDDIIFIGSAGSYECIRSLKAMIKISSILGVPLKESEALVTIHGLEINTLQMVVRVLENKIRKALTLMDALLWEMC